MCRAREATSAGWSLGTHHTQILEEVAQEPALPCDCQGGTPLTLSFFSLKIKCYIKA